MYIDKDYVLNHIKQSMLDKLCKEDNGSVNYDKLTGLGGAIDSADSIINGYLKKVVTNLPLTAPPPSIQLCSFNISIYNLFSNSDAYMDIPQFVRDKYKDSIAFLTAVSNGDADIGDVPDTILVSQIYFTSEDKFFDRGTF